MAEPAPRLHVISGEVPDDPVEALRVQLETEREQRRMLERDLRGKRLQIGNLEAQLADKLRDEPQAETVRAVLDPWCDQVLEAGWWSLRPRFEPGDARWKATRAALNKGYDPPYLRQVVVGALLEADNCRRHHRKFERHWLEPQTVFGGFIETRYENAMDPKFERVRLAREAPVALRDRWVSVELLADECACGHLRFDHDRPRPLEGVLDPPCAVHGCYCTGFDDVFVRGEAWLREQDELARKRMAS